MASRVGIANQALTILGADRVTSLEDNTENARRMTAIYDPTLEDLLRKHPWNFSIQRKQLARLASTPTFGYDYEFQLPGDCLRPIEINDGVNLVTAYKVEGRKVLSNYDTLYIKYIGNISDPNQFTSQFITVFAYRLAAELAFAITNNKANAELVHKLYEARLQEAKETDAQESDSTNVIDDDEWTVTHRQ